MAQTLGAPLNTDGGKDFVQGQGGNFGDDENGSEVIFSRSDDEAAYGQTGILQSEGHDMRNVNISLGNRRIFLGLQQPLYTHIDTPPAKILKLMNTGAAILLMIGGFYRLIASFGGSVVQPMCDSTKFRDQFCPGGNPDTCTLRHNTTCCVADKEGDYIHINCAWVLTYAVAPNDGFPNLIVAAGIIFYGFVTFMDEVYEATVKHLMGHLSMMSTLWGRGLFYLFMSSVLMTHAHTILMACSGMVMALAFLYITLYLVVEYTSYGDYLGFRKGPSHSQQYAQTSTTP